MSKTPFVTKEMIEEIVKTYPTPFHIYDEKGIRERLMPKRKAISENVSLIVGEGTTDIFSMYEISGDAEFELSSEFAVMVVVEGEAYIDGELYRKGETLFVKDEKKLSFKGENFAVALCE